MEGGEAQGGGGGFAGYDVKCHAILEERLCDRDKPIFHLVISFLSPE